MPMPGMPWGRPAKEKRFSQSLYFLACTFDIVDDYYMEQCIMGDKKRKNQAKVKKSFLAHTLGIEADC